MAHARLDKAIVLYMDPALLDAGEKVVIQAPGAACGKCMMFLKDTSECSILSPPEVDKMGVCGLFVGGNVMTSEDHEPMELVPKKVAGYTDDGPTRCGLCKHFQKPKACWKVAGEVHSNGCCNHFENKGNPHPRSY